MPVLTTPYPLPDVAMLALPPSALAGVAVSIIRRVYNVEVDYTAAGLARLDTVMRAQLRVGAYTPETFPAVLALVLGAFLGEALLHHVPSGRWGDTDEDIYHTPLPFLIFTRGDYERQINTVEQMLTFFWTGDGYYPADYLAQQCGHLQRIGIAEAPRTLTN